LHQVKRAGLFLFGELQLGFGLIDLRPGLVNLLALAVNLCVDIVDIGLCNRNLRLCLIDRDLVVAIIDAGEQIPDANMLVVRNGNCDDIAADFWRNRKAACGDERVVRGRPPWCSSSTTSPL